MTVRDSLFYFSLLLVLYGRVSLSEDYPEGSKLCKWRYGLEDASHSVYKNTAGNCNPCIWNYEFLPRAYEDKYTCIGGKDGRGFQIHRRGTSVQVILVWLGGHKHGFRSMYVRLFSGEAGFFGSFKFAKPDASFVFNYQETLVGSVTLGLNSDGTRIGYLHFKTSEGREFKVGTLRKPFYIPSRETFLTGFYGKHGADINSLAIILMARVESVNLVNVDYTSLDSLKAVPEIQSHVAGYCNLGYVKQSNQLSLKKTVGIKHEWTSERKLGHQVSLNVEAKVPIFEKSKGELKFSLDEESVHSESVDTTSERTMNFPVVVPPQSYVKAEFFWSESPIELNYTGTLVYRFKNLQKSSFPVSGVYKGLIVSSLQANYSTFPVSDYSDCLRYDKLQ